jgi:hypothetical protein
MLRSSFSKASLALILLTSLSLGAMDIELSEPERLKIALENLPAGSTNTIPATVPATIVEATKEVVANLDNVPAQVPTPVVPQVLANNPSVISPALAEKVAKPTVLGKIASAFKAVPATLVAAPAAVCNFCKKNPKTVIAAGVATAVIGAASYLYAKGHFDKYLAKAKAYFKAAPKAVIKK